MNRFFLLFILLSSHALAVQHPTGFTDLYECLQQGSSATFALEEADSRQFVLSLKNGVVVDEGAIVTAEGRVLTDTETYQSDQHKLLKGHRDIATEEQLYFPGKLAVISTPGQENWYHWLFQVLPRLKILQEADVAYDKIYLNNLNYPWQRESIEIVMDSLGISSDKLLLTTGHTVIESNLLVVPSVPFMPSKLTPFPAWLRQFIRSTFLKEDDTHLTPERIYISRAKASMRRVSNENELVDWLRENNFVVVNLEELPIHAQATLFHQAKIVIGVHGSGLANLIFAEPATQVIEIDHCLEDSEPRNNLYKAMALRMGCHYHRFFDQQVEEKDLDSDLTISIPDFAKFCQTLENF